MDTAQALAQNLQQLRRSQRYSQQRLADLAELPRSTVSHMESGAGNPSLSTLLKVAAALRVSVEELLAQPRQDCQLFRAADIAAQCERGGDVCRFNLLPEAIIGLNISRFEMKPGAQFTGHPHLAGSKEYLYGLIGQIQVLVAGQLFTVAQGDVLAFPGDQAHSYLNRSGREAQAISIVVPLPSSYR